MEYDIGQPPSTFQKQGTKGESDKLRHEDLHTAASMRADRPRGATESADTVPRKLMVSTAWTSPISREHRLRGARLSTTSDSWISPRPSESALARILDISDWIVSSSHEPLI